MQLLVERKLPSQKAAIQGCEREFEIVGVKSTRFLHRSRAGAGPQPDIPHTLNNGSDSLLGLLLSLLVRKRKQNVNVGIGEEILAPVATEGDKRNALRRLS